MPMHMYGEERRCLLCGCSKPRSSVDVLPSFARDADVCWVSAKFRYCHTPLDVVEVFFF
jgi:hypothetical protein